MVLDAVHFGGRRAAGPVVCAVAARNGLGFDAHQTWAFRRAEVSAFAPTPFRCANGFQATMAPVRTLDPRTEGIERLVVLGEAVLESLLPSLALVPRGARVALLPCLGERYGRVRGLSAGGARLRDALAARVRRWGSEAVVSVHARGHAGLAFALLEACGALAAGAVDVALVGGLDTGYDAEVVDALVEDGRLFDGVTVEGVVPGEGAAFLLVAMPETARRMRCEVRARIESVVTGREPAAPGGGVACAGLGLSRALRAIADRVQDEGRAIDWWIGDLTNEAWRGHEFALAFPRACAGVSGDTPVLEFLPPLLGDLGAATMATGAVVAAEGFLRGDPPARTCVVMASSVTEDRGAVLFAAP